MAKEIKVTVFVVGKTNSKENPCKSCGSTTGCDCPIDVVQTKEIEMKVQEATEYTIGEFVCPICKKYQKIYCRKTPKRKHRHVCR